MTTTRGPALRSPAVATAACAALAAAAAVATAAAALPAATLAVLLVAAGIEATAAADATGRDALAAATGPLPRVALRALAVVLLAGRAMVPGTVVAGVGVAAAVVVGGAAACAACRTVLALLRRPPVLTRNLPVDVAVPAALPAQLLGRVPFLGAAEAVLAAAVWVAGRPAWLTALLAAAGCLVVLAPLALGAAQVATFLRHRLRDRCAAAAVAAAAAVQADTVLYFAGRPEEVYQVEMWLEPVERLGRRALVLLRDDAVLAALAPTSLPVVCTPYNGTVAALGLSPRVAGLFVTHTGNNLSLIRRPETRSVFVGHGDSDKPDSANAFARVYDEVWVAGPLGRERYRRAGVGVADERVVEVGRPQLAVAAVGMPAVPTVLYAPTWEGWGDDPFHTSLPHLGPELVAALLARGDVRVLYRPHPLTGRRSPAVRRADERVRALLREAGGVAGAVETPGTRRTADLLDAAVASGAGPFDRAAWSAARERREAAYWAAAPAGTHRIVTAAGPSLVSCFAQTSLLLGDVSSVVTDFLAFDRPYATLVARDVTDAELFERYPMTRGGGLVRADLAALQELVDCVLAGADPHRSARHAVVAEALGDPSRAQERFAAAVEELLQR